MKTIKHEIKLERSVKIILGVLALGIFLNAFATPISKEFFGIKDAQAGLLQVNKIKGYGPNDSISVWIENKQ